MSMVLDPSNSSNLEQMALKGLTGGNDKLPSQDGHKQTNIIHAYKQWAVVPHPFRDCNKINEKITKKSKEKPQLK